MCTTIRIVLAMVREAFLSRAALHLENLALRQQLAALDRKGARPSLRMADRLFWVVLSRLWSGWREILVIVKPETVIGWHRKGFRRFWTRKSRRGKPGRPPVSSEFRGLIRRMSRENPLWGAPRIHGELRMLGFEVSEAVVSKYMPRHPKPPSQTWRTFLENHVGCLASTDFFVVPTATFSLLFVLVVLRHERRRIVQIGPRPPDCGVGPQQIREAFPWETAPRYMIRDRDRVYLEPPRVYRRAFGSLGCFFMCVQGFIEHLPCFVRRDISDGAVKTLGVVPIDPFQRFPFKLAH